MPTSHRNLRLDEALALPGCPVCRLVLQRVSQSLESIQDELVLDPDYREKIDGAWGFCNVHAQQWLDEAQPLSTAIIYEAVLGRVSRELERLSPGRAGRGGQLRSRLPGAQNGNRTCSMLVESRVCPLCGVREEQERLVVIHLLEELRGASFRERYRESDGLCVSHVNLALCVGPDTEAFEVLRARMQQSHEELRSQLREVIRKHDYRHRDDTAGPEWNAIEQSVRHVSGMQGIDGRRSRQANPA